MWSDGECVREIEGYLYLCVCVHQECTCFLQHPAHDCGLLCGVFLHQIWRVQMQMLKQTNWALQMPWFWHGSSTLLVVMVVKGGLILVFHVLCFLFGKFHPLISAVTPIFFEILRNSCNYKFNTHLWLWYTAWSWGDRWTLSSPHQWRCVFLDFYSVFVLK